MGESRNHGWSAPAPSAPTCRSERPAWRCNRLPSESCSSWWRCRAVSSGSRLARPCEIPEDGTGRERLQRGHRVSCWPRRSCSSSDHEMTTGRQTRTATAAGLPDESSSGLRRPGAQHGDPVPGRYGYSSAVALPARDQDERGGLDRDRRIRQGGSAHRRGRVRAGGGSAQHRVALLARAVPLAPYFAAVALAAWFGGVGPSIAAIVLSLPLITPYSPWNHLARGRSLRTNSLRCSSSSSSQPSSRCSAPVATGRERVAGE